MNRILNSGGWPRPSRAKAVLLATGVGVAWTIAQAAHAQNSEPAAQSPAARTPVSVEAGIEEVVTGHPSVRSDRLLEKASLEDLQAARLARLPSLSVEQQSLRGQPISSINVEQLLWTGGRVQARIESASATVMYRDAQIHESQYTVALRFLEAWQAMQLAVLRISSINMLQYTLIKYRRQMQRRVDAQVSPAIELQLIAAREAQAQADLTQASAGIRSSRSRLDALLGGARLDFALGASEIRALAAAAGALALPYPADELENAIRSHPTVIKARLQAVIARHEADIQSAAKWPEIYVRLQKNIQSFPSVPQNGILIGLRYQPGAGFASAATARAAAVRVEAQEESMETALPPCWSKPSPPLPWWSNPTSGNFWSAGAAGRRSSMRCARRATSRWRWATPRPRWWAPLIGSRFAPASSNGNSTPWSV